MISYDSTIPVIEILYVNIFESVTFVHIIHKTSQMDKYSYIANAHGNYIEELYQSYKNDPESVDQSWQKFFEGFEFSQKDYNGAGASGDSPKVSSKETQVRNLIHAYRMRGHLKSKTNPVRDRRPHDARIGLEDFGLTESDLKESFSVCYILPDRVFGKLGANWIKSGVAIGPICFLTQSFNSLSRSPSTFSPTFKVT